MTLDYQEPASVSRAELDALREAEDALRRIGEVQPATLGMIRDNGFVFETPLGKPDDDRTEAELWEKLAFSIYTDLCEAEAIARSALARLDAARKAAA